MTDTTFSSGPQRTFTGAQLDQIAFPLGGIGAGTISLGGYGELRDFEIANRPAKGRNLPTTFFAMRACPEGGEPVARVLQAQRPSGYWCLRNPAPHGGDGLRELGGAPRFERGEFRGEYPTATLDLFDPDVPVEVRLTAWNPFIPHNVHDSALPVALFEWTFTNPTDRPVEVSVAATLSNPFMSRTDDAKPSFDGQLNTPRRNAALNGIFLSNTQAQSDHPEAGTMALWTPQAEVDLQARWRTAGFWDHLYNFWADFLADGRLDPIEAGEPVQGVGVDMNPAHCPIAALAVPAVVAPGASVTIPIAMTWHSPMMANPWRPDLTDPAPLKTYVGEHFEDAWSVAEYVVGCLNELREGTERWQRAAFDTSLPSVVTEAATSQASIIRTQTCFLLADGNFYAWEGCCDGSGCCPGSCTHVWNYEQALAFLFPSLERSMRRCEFLHNTRETGNMAFRTALPPGSHMWEMRPCIDGQMGVVMQVYRDWRLSGDDAFLKELWPKVKLALEYAWTMTPERIKQIEADGGKPEIESVWDPNKDGVAEGEQHNTYDMEFYGPDTMGTSLYLGALRACEKMARHLGEDDKAEEYRAVFESGRARCDAELFNGEYYEQKTEVVEGAHVWHAYGSDVDACACASGGCGKPTHDVPPEPKYQYGPGCLADQLIGQWAAHVMDLGYLFNPDHARSATEAIFRHNFRDSFRTFANMSRVYAMGDDAGLLTCTWPRGGRPRLPFPYADEVWSGIEYEVAALLIYEGLIEEGLRVVQAVADRHSGDNRNPWNQMECGHHYARAMASWSVKLALDGFVCDAVAGRMRFAPKLGADDTRTFWSSGTAWGVYAQRPADGSFYLETLHGEQTLRRLELADLGSGDVRVEGPAGQLAAHTDGDAVIFDTPVTLQAGETLFVQTKS